MEEPNYQISKIKLTTVDELLQFLFSKEGGKSIVDLETLFLTYPSFSSSLDLLERVKKFYKSSRTEEKEDIVFLRIINFLKLWIQKFWYDDCLDLYQMDEFLIEICGEALTSGQTKIVSKLRETLSKKFLPSPPDIMYTLSPVSQTLPRKRNFPILETDLHVLVEQLTIRDWSYFSKITPKELNLQLSTRITSCSPKTIPLPWVIQRLLWIGHLKGDRNCYFSVIPIEIISFIISQCSRTTCSMLGTLVQWFNKVSNWIVMEICTTENPEKRLQILSKFIDIGWELKNRNNFHGVMEIFCGLNNSCVLRLKKMWAVLDFDHQQRWKQLSDLMTPDRGYKSLRVAIECATLPALPYLGLFLTNLTFINDGNRSEIDGKMNWNKYLLIAECIKKIQSFQMTNYKILPNGDIQEQFEQLVVLDEETLYRLSLYMEPRMHHQPERPKILDIFLEK